ncbi:MAG: hypothetical protein BMS9Abin28_2494 [Anaerolineae bacterium]|nr:MAG: hypothetical protein BMS9Abin28_2494 [Anaerolineae bacterium]
MFIAPEIIYEIARMRMKDRLSEADRHRLAKEAKGETQTSGFERFQGVVVFIGMALLPLGESLRSPFSEPRSLDISSQ